MALSKYSKPLNFFSYMVENLHPNYLRDPSNSLTKTIKANTGLLGLAVPDKVVNGLTVETAAVAQKAISTITATAGYIQARTDASVKNIGTMSTTFLQAPINKKLNVSIGLPFSFLSGDLFDRQESYVFDRKGIALIALCGMDNDETSAKRMRNGLKNKFGVDQAVLISNFTHGPKIGDFLQTAGYELINSIDIPAIHAAQAMVQAITEKGEVYVVAHSQGSAVFEKAIQLLSGEQRSHVHYQGFGSETYIDATELGLASARNVRNIGDAIPATGIVSKIATSFASPLGRFFPSPPISQIAGRNWETIDSVGNRNDQSLLNNSLMRTDEFKATTNHHNFSKYYLDYVLVPEQNQQ